MNNHLYILHLFPGTTDNPKYDTVAQMRQNKILEELNEQGISDYSLIQGFYGPDNTHLAIHRGHRKIIELAKQQGLDRCIIAEDDIVFTCPTSYQYFLSQIPESYDIFSGLVYSAEIRDNRIMNGGSGMTSLYVVHSRFYDFYLSINPLNHVDRELAMTAFKHEYYLCQPYVVYQRGGYSFNRRETLYYDEYLKGKAMYGVG